MGGSSKGGSTQTQTIPARTEVTPVQRNVSVVVGYKYYFGAHMALTHGPVDFVSRIKVGDKCAWSGLSYGKSNEGTEINQNSTGVRINISASNLFGGVDGEGGVSGPVDFLQGYDTQAVNDYLAARLGGADGTPAFRGVTSMALRQVYVSANNPYLKPWAFTMTRTDITTRGDPSWYINKSRIGREPSFPYVDEDGVEIFSPPTGPYSDISAEYNGSTSNPDDFFIVGNYKYLKVGSLSETGNTSFFIKFNEGLVADVLLVGGGGSSSSFDGAGAGAGQVKIAKMSFEKNEEITVQLGGPGGLSPGANGGHSFIAPIGGNLGNAVLIAYGGARGLNQGSSTCQDGIGGAAIGCGSGATGTNTTAGGCANNTSGGQGVASSGGGSPKSKFSELCSGTQTFSSGGCGGGGGACGDGEDGGESNGIRQCVDGQNVCTGKPGKGGKGGAGLHTRFTGEELILSYGGGGDRGRGSGDSPCNLGDRPASWLSVHGDHFGRGGDGFGEVSGAAARGSGGLFVLRWRVTP